MENKIRFMNIEVTNKCNLNCSMCDIWSEVDKRELPEDMLKAVLNAGSLSDDLDLTLTGGEPFMHSRFNELVRLILDKNPAWLKTISTNGTLKGKILSFLDMYHTKLSNDFSLHISLDGIKCHDSQRGKSFKDIMDTIQAVRDSYPSINIKIKLTITPLNYKDILSTYRYCKDNGLEFRAKLVEYAPAYTNRVKKREFVFDDAKKMAIVKALTRIYNGEVDDDPHNAVFLDKTIKFLQGKNPPAPCQTPSSRLFIFSNRDIYSCIHMGCLGNIEFASLDYIWKSYQAKIGTGLIDNKCRNCVSYHGRSDL